MAVLYQKFRPQKFAEVVGQEPIVRTLLNASKAGELAHAYLFTGSRGVGKTTIARLLAKAANCQKLKDGDPCGACETCLAIAAGNSLDIIEIDAASHTGVDNVREVIEHAQFRPTQMKTKVFIVDEVHMLSKAAFNALLKTLEEPPQHAMFILATTDIEKVPATIVSRTQRFDFKRIPPQQMAEALESILKKEKLKLSPGVIDAVVSQSEGSMRDALSKLGMVLSLGDKATLEDSERLLGVASLESVQKLVTLIAEHNSTTLPGYFDETFARGSDPAVFNRSVLQYLRLLLNAKLTGQSADQVLPEHLNILTLPQLMLIIRLFLRAYKELSSAPSPDLPLLLAAVEASLHGAAAQAAPAQAAPAPAQAVSESAPRINRTQENSEFTPEIKSVRKTAFTVDDEAPKNLDQDVTLEEVRVWWLDVISRIKTDNSPIATLLKNSPLTEVKDGKIIISVKYLFHKEHFDNKKHSIMITDAIREVSGKNMTVRAVINKNVPETERVTTVEALSDALKVFGGELVE